MTASASMVCLSFRRCTRGGRVIDPVQTAVGVGNQHPTAALGGRLENGIRRHGLRQGFDRWDRRLGRNNDRMRRMWQIARQRMVRVLATATATSGAARERTAADTEVAAPA